jgi:hypothetical protein
MICAALRRPGSSAICPRTGSMGGRGSPRWGAHRPPRDDDRRRYRCSRRAACYASRDLDRVRGRRGSGALARCTTPPRRPRFDPAGRKAARHAGRAGDARATSRSQCSTGPSSAARRLRSRARRRRVSATWRIRRVVADAWPAARSWARTPYARAPRWRSIGSPAWASICGRAFGRDDVASPGGIDEEQDGASRGQARARQHRRCQRPRR